MANIQVPRYNQRQVSLNQGNSGRVVGADNAASFGLSGETINQGVRQGYQLFESAKQSADKTRVLSAERALSQAETEMLYGQDGAFQKRGQAAFGTIPQVTESYQKKVAEIAQTLTGEARSAFEASAAGRFDDVSRNLNKHVSAQAAAWQDSEDEAFIKTENNKIISNPFDTIGINNSLMKQVQVVEGKAARAGWGPEETKNQILNVQSTAHLGVITQLTDMNNDRAAKEYFEANKTTLTGDALLRAEKLVKAGSLHGEAMRTADAFAGQKLSLGAQLAETNKIEDPDLRKATQEQVKLNESNRRLVESANEQDLNKSIASQIDRGAKWTDIPQSRKDQLSSSMRSSLENYANDRVKGISPKTDWTKWTRLTEMASDPAGREEFKRMDLVKFRPYLADSEYKSMVEKQDGIRSGSDKTTKELDGIRTNQDIIIKTAGAVGITYDDKNNSEAQNKKFNSYRQAVESRVSDFTQQNRRNPNTTEMQVIVDELLKPNKGGFFSGGQYGGQRRFEIPSDAPYEADVDSVSDIDASLLLEIRASKAYRKRPTEATIMELYKMMVNKNGK